jgi:hypothetical protein
MDTNDNNDPWVPKKDPDIDTIGVIGPDGMFGLPKMPRHGAGKTRLSDSANPIVRNIGRFCEATPPIELSMSTFGGFLIGLRMAMLYPEMTEQLLHDILIEGKSGSTDTTVLDETVETLIQGLGNDD